MLHTSATAPYRGLTVERGTLRYAPDLEQVAAHVDPGEG
jgi:hypothetical protein